MRVSVIVPVFNAASYIRDAVESALVHEETSEVILVEDASTDNSLEVCEALARAHARVVVTRHPGGANRGPGASRNLGIRNTTADFLAFLDADDYYLPHRMRAARRCFDADPNADGVYEAVEARFESEEGTRLWAEHRGPALKAVPSPQPPPRLLFEAFVLGGYLGHVHTNGWTVRRRIFERTGLFDENLRLHQDDAMWVKFAAMGKMVAGEQSRPVAIRRVYDDNRSLVDRDAGEVHAGYFALWNTLWRWGRRHLKLQRHHLLMMRLVDTVVPLPDETQGALSRIRHVTGLLRECPRLSAETYFWQTARKALAQRPRS